MSIQIYNEDCISGCPKQFTDKSVDLVICDPPFGIEETSFGKHYFRDETKVVDGYKEAPEDYYNFSLAWINEAKRILKDTGSLYIISGWSKLKDLMMAVDDAGLYTVNHVIWKYNFGVNTTKKFVSSHYHILYLKKKKNSRVTFNTNCRFGSSEVDEDNRSLLYKDLEDVWLIGKDYRAGETKNKNKLPNDLIRKIIEYSSNPGDIVCDFFLGNFTTAIVAKEMGRVPCGFEINSNGFDHFMEKLKSIRKGSYLETLRKIPEDRRYNRGKKFTSEEKDRLYSDFLLLVKEKKFKKKDAIETLIQDYGRGRWSIERVLKEKAVE